MSPDTAAQRPDTAVDQQPEGDRRDDGAALGDPPGRSRPGPEAPARHGRMWTWLTVGAAAVFIGTVAVVATDLFVGVDEVSDTPEHAVEEFLGALLDEHDAAAAREWLCADKDDRDLTEATADLAAFNEQAGVDWSNVTETGRSVGEATVTAELSTGGEAATWTFTLVAEDSDPQWQVCDMAVE